MLECGTSVSRYSVVRWLSIEASGETKKAELAIWADMQYTHPLYVTIITGYCFNRIRLNTAQ
jgi:hypothetical protein